MTMRTDAFPDCPEWHNPAMFIAWIEKNISPAPGQRYSADALHTPASVDDYKK